MNKDSRSSAEQGGLQDPIVLDFLYSDSQRVGSLLSQFDDAGHLQQVSQGSKVAVGNKRGRKLTLGGGATVLGTGAQGNLGFEVGPDQTGEESIHRVYDPLWSNALTLLDFLSNAELLQRDLSQAGVGQIIHAKGSLTLLDLSLVGKLWNKGPFRQLIADGMAPTENRNERRTKGNQHLRKKASEIDVFIEVINEIPHTAQAFIKPEKGNPIWCGLRETGLIAPASDITMMHGPAVAGEWIVVGILDARPDTAIAEQPDEKMMADIGVSIATGRGVAGGLTMMLAPLVRQLVGRPDEAFGVTPLLIYREVSTL
jgi:hypothetical protein